MTYGPTWLSWTIGVITALWILLGAFGWYQWRRARRAGADHERIYRKIAPADGRLIALFCATMALSTCIMLPISTPEAHAGRTVLGLVVLLLGGPISVMFTRRRLSLCRPLTDGIWYDCAHELADRFGITLRDVLVMRSIKVNAHAASDDTIILTTGLLNELDIDEVPVLIAHELGHLKYRHCEITAARNSVVGCLRLGAWILAQSRVNPHPGVAAILTLNNPLFVSLVFVQLVNLIVRRGNRARQCEADRCAVEWLGDPDLVIRALAHLMVSNAPFRFKSERHRYLYGQAILRSNYRIAAIKRLKDGRDTETEATANPGWP